MIREWSVRIRKWSPTDDPEDGETKEFNPEAISEEDAKQRAVTEATSGFDPFIESWEEGYEVIECHVNLDCGKK